LQHYSAPIFTPEFPKADPYLFGKMVTPTSTLCDYGLARQAQETVGGGAPTLPFFSPFLPYPENLVNHVNLVHASDLR